MGRNKIVYALSDWTLVVSADTNHSGTRAGAIENLKNGWAPVMVRISVDTPPGNHDLLKKGALPLSPEILDTKDTSLKETLDQLQTKQETASLATSPLNLFAKEPDVEEHTGKHVKVEEPALPLRVIEPDTFWKSGYLASDIPFS